jgi:hypothetical protein
MALGCAEAFGQRPQLISNVGVNNIEHRLFDSAEHLTGRAPAGDEAGLAPQKQQHDVAAL